MRSSTSAFSTVAAPATVTIPTFTPVQPRPTLSPALQDSLRHWESALHAYVQVHNEVGMGHSLIELSKVHFQAARVDRALAYAQAAATMLENTHAQATYVQALYQQGLIYQEMGNWMAAETCFKQALTVLAEASMDEVVLESQVLLQLGQVYAQQGKYLFALACYEAVLDHVLTHECPDALAELLAEVLIATLHLCEQTYSGEAVIATYQSVLQPYLAAQNPTQIARLVQQLGQFHESKARYRLALECYAQALKTIPPVAL